MDSVAACIAKYIFHIHSNLYTSAKIFIPEMGEAIKSYCLALNPQCGSSQIIGGTSRISGLTFFFFLKDKENNTDYMLEYSEGSESNPRPKCFKKT